MRITSFVARLGLLASAALLAQGAQAASQLVAFGDSLVDNGNTVDYLDVTFPASPYYQGRFSNGPVAVEYMAQQLGLSLDDRAVGGAYTGNGNRLAETNPTRLSLIASTGTRQQISAYISEKGGAVDSQALYYIWAGGNDFFTNPTGATVASAVGNLAADVSALYAAGARNFFIPNLPDLATTAPSLQRDATYQAGARQLTLAFNSYLNNAMNGLETQLVGLDVQVYDAYSFLTTLRNGYAARGFNVTTPCLVTGATPSLCSNPSQYYLWDNVHPTAGVHQAIGTAMATAAMPVPEPEQWALTFTGLAVVGFMRRRQQRQAA
ncbi:PEP-CTERM sorting domain-containing protein [Aquabacterium lacunae]|uniref:PEP-CTERM sorting domain-containing protein n=1 Tax=Aquabacterium lacunae TaxID=2528630 RepID=A0A4Q9GYD3_9BURK|nr:SGNH/GDSL hydrolase family protein [Aquabacterium lacunae]TBO30456.1 PEP-CTERM sorting domain-containing protein [Aquabacterium lacunae]